MLQIFINGVPAVIPENISFDYNSENRLFTDADDYTLSIALPLKDCPLNQRIFGNINRFGHRISGEPFDIHIVAGPVSIKGSGIITSITDVECKIQFLGGKSAENYYSDLKEIYINNLDLGEVPSEYLKAEDVPVSVAWSGHSGGMNMVAIPWVNSNTGNIQNNTRMIEPGEQPSYTPGKWKPGADQLWVEPEGMEEVPDHVFELSWMPYLIDIAKAVCKAIDYDFDFSSWENSKWNELLVCNAVPYTWDHKWATLMPHWSVLEFFRNLEPLIEGSFNIDSVAKSVVFDSFKENFSKDTVVLENVIDEFSSDVFDEDEECKMLSERYVGYALSDFKVAKAYSCPWLISDFKSRKNAIKDYETPDDLSAAAWNGKWTNYKSNMGGPRDGVFTFYVKSVDRYVSYRVILSKYKFILPGLGERYFPGPKRAPILLNNLGPRNIPLRDPDASVDLEIQFAPAVIDDTDDRRMLFVPLGEYEIKSDEPLYDEDSTVYKEKIYDSFAMRMLDNGEDDGSNAYFSNIAVGFFPGGFECCRNANEIFPIVDNVEFDLSWIPWQPENLEYTLSLQDNKGKFSAFPKLNRLVKYEYSFLSDVIPDVRSVFYIRGHKYLCEKISANFSESGMSQKLKGVFWRIFDD